MNYYRLLKLLYLADRASLKEGARPIIGGRLVAMERGPLHSACFELIKGTDAESGWWSKYFRTDHWDLEMIEDPGNGDLSKREVDLLNRIRLEYEADDDFEVGKKSHVFPEFINNDPGPGKSKTIPFDELLAAVGRSPDAPAILDDANCKAVFDSVFGN